MPLLNELLRRVAQANQGVYASGDPIDRVSKWDQPMGVRAWRAWAEADGAFVRRDLSEAARWLDAAESWAGDAPSDPLRGEIALSWARVLDAADEPRRAMPYARAAWNVWFALARNPLQALSGNSLSDLLRALTYPESFDLQPQQLFVQWMNDRASPNLHYSATQVFSACRGVGDGAPAFALAKEWREWYRKAREAATLPANQIAILEAGLLGDLANLHDQLGDPQAALDAYLEARTMLSGPAVAADPSRLRQLDFNIGNQQAKVGKHTEAIAAFEQAEKAFDAAGQEEPALRCRHAIITSRWKLGESAKALLPALEDVLCSYERLIETGSESADAATQNLHRGNGLWLSLASRLLGEEVGHERFLHQLFASRQGNTRGHTVWRKVLAAKGKTPDVLDEISLLLARLGDESERLVGVSLESAVDELLAVTLVGGQVPLSQRLSVERFSAECMQVLEAMIRQRRGATLDLASRAIIASSDPSALFKDTCAALWAKLPAEMRRRLDAASVVYFVPEPVGALDEMPLELLHDGTTYLGLRTPIVRAASWAQLPRALSPNFVDRLPSGTLAVVRGPDVPVLGQLWQADDEVATVEAAGRECFKDVKKAIEPSAQDFVTLLASGPDALHFTGHSYADDAGEYLVVGNQTQLGVPELGTIRSQPAPASIFCSCLVGLHRATRAGMARGIATALLDAGAPGIVATMVPLPDQVGHDFALAVHFHAKSRSLAEAVMAARLTLSRRFHPAAWGCFAYFGRHDARMNPSAEARVPTWPALLTRCLATRGAMWRPELEAALRRDDTLTAALSKYALALLDAYVTGKRGSKIPKAPDGEKTLAADRRFALMAAASLARVVCEKDEAHARQEASDALLVQRITEDTYLLAAAVDAAVRRGLLAFQDDSSTKVVNRAIATRGWLSRSATGLSAAHQALDELQARWSKTLTMQAPEMFGFSPELWEAADRGDRTAMKDMVWVMKAREASPAALASNLSWTEWLYRLMGADGDGPMADFCGVVDAAERSGRLGSTPADALRTLFKRYIGPGEIELEHVTAALKAFAGKDAEQGVIRLFQLYDRITSQEREVPSADIERGITDAADARAGGLSAFFALQLGARSLAAGDVAAARNIAETSLADFMQLSATDPAYETRANLCAAFLYNVAQASGDRAFQTKVLRAHRPRIEAYAASMAAAQE